MSGIESQRHGFFKWSMSIAGFHFTCENLFRGTWMKPNLFFIGQLILFLAITSCVTKPPEFASMHDGVRCPHPTQQISANSKRSNRAPASTSTKSIEQVCDQLFVK